jgi:hypothetical protein
MREGFEQPGLDGEKPGDLDASQTKSGSPASAIHDSSTKLWAFAAADQRLQDRPNEIAFLGQSLARAALVGDLAKSL